MIALNRLPATKANHKPAKRKARPKRKPADTLTRDLLAWAAEIRDTLYGLRDGIEEVQRAAESARGGKLASVLPTHQLHALVADLDGAVSSALDLEVNIQTPRRFKLRSPLRGKR